MSESDWTFLTDDPGQPAVDRGVTTGEDKPNGGGNFVFGFNSLTNDPGVVGLYTNQAGFAPTPALKGGSIRMAMKRGISGGPTEFSGMSFMQLGGTDSVTPAYLLGLGDADPYHIILAKNNIAAGCPDVEPNSQANGGLGVLARSVATYPQNLWLHLRLDVIVNLNGDVLLRVYRNDLGANPVSPPVWTLEPGLELFTDDQLGINSGSQPLTSGRMGFAIETRDVNRRFFVDHIESFSQV